MFRLVIRTVVILFGGLVAAKLVELFLVSARGQALVKQGGLDDLTTHQGVQLAQKYARAAVAILTTAAVGVQENLESRALGVRRPGWPERVQTYATLLLAAGSLAKTAADFFEERRKVLGDGRSRA
jgi:hypothetical protein